MFGNQLVVNFVFVLSSQIKVEIDGIFALEGLGNGKIKPNIYRCIVFQNLIYTLPLHR